MVYRFAALSLVLALGFVGYRMYANWSQDVDLPATADTAEWIAAIQLHDEGAQAVVIKADGTIEPSPGYKPGSTDKDPVWRPDGNRLFFIGDRENQETNVFRWNFGANAVARRTYNSRAKAQIFFAGADVPNANKTALMVSGKNVVEFNPTDGATWLVLPPTDKERQTTDEGTGSTMQMAYEQIGDSFRLAKWTPDKAFVVAVMRNEEGEVLVVQPLAGGELPKTVMAGQRIDFDIHPESGRIFYMVEGFRPLNLESVPKEWIVDGKLKLPFHHMIGWLDPGKLAANAAAEDAGGVVAQATDPKEAFRGLKLSPDGAQMAFVATVINNDGMVEPRGLVICPAETAGGSKAGLIHAGAVQEIDWHPGGMKIVFSESKNGERGLFTIDLSNGAVKSLTAGKGDFAQPSFSPQGK